MGGKTTTHTPAKAKRKASSSVLVKMKGISKRFHNVVALDKVDFEIGAGEIHSILGENGAGKTTLMNILYGLYHPDEGEIFVEGKKADIKGPHDAIELGIGMIHQHFQLVPPLSVLKNITLGYEPKKLGYFFDEKESEQKVSSIMKEYGLEVDLKAKVSDLEVGALQRVEIVKALYRGSKILIMDEPTAVLTPQESTKLMETLKNLANKNLAVIPFISHKLDEVLNISDRITVLRNGRLVEVVDTVKTDKKKLARAMVGRELVFKTKAPKARRGKIALKVSDLKAFSDTGTVALKGVSFELSTGEILGIAGVSGNGQEELAEVLAGLRHATSGGVSLLGKDITNRNPRSVKESGLGYIPADRMRMGIIKDFSVAENLLLKHQDENEFRSKGMLPFKNSAFVDEEKMKQKARDLIKEFDIKVPDENTPAKNLSGGNIQKLILARELWQQPHVLVACYPTRGLDVGSIESVRKILNKQVESGSALLLISESLEELKLMSNRIAVMYEGEILDIVQPSTTRESIGLLMGGKRAKAK